ncbi:hypothetical protein CCP4SC76_7680003 [Gammaproteobacteria bacterium]
MYRYEEGKTYVLGSDLILDLLAKARNGHSDMRAIYPGFDLTLDLFSLLNFIDNIEGISSNNKLLNIAHHTPLKPVPKDLSTNLAALCETLIAGPEECSGCPSAFLLFNIGPIKSGIRNDLALRFTKEFMDIYDDYIEGRDGNRELNDKSIECFKNSSETESAVNRILIAASEYIEEHPECQSTYSSIPYSTIEQYYAEKHPNSNRPLNDITWTDAECGLIVGGVGSSGTNTFQNDVKDNRKFSGDILVKSVLDCKNKPIALELTTNLTLEIFDTFDFCPGNNGIGGQVQCFTAIMRAFESCGQSKDVGIHAGPFQLNQKSMKIGLPKKCKDNCTHFKNPPGNACIKPEDECGCPVVQPPPPPGCCGDDCSSETANIAAGDPNMKQLVSIRNQLMGYRIDFENLHTATAPAANVRISDVLDPNLRLGSCRLGDIHFGKTTIDVPDNRVSYQTKVQVTDPIVQVDVTAGVNAATNEVFWQFRSIDPATGETPTDATLGFLPPEDGTGRGQGWVEFTVAPQQDLPVGTVIRNAATIVFDNNAPMVTNEVVVDPNNTNTTTHFVVPRNSGIFEPFWPVSLDNLSAPAIIK